MIYDCFTFFNEFDLLKMRLKLVAPHTDRIVIVEADTGFNGKPKDFNFFTRREEFREWEEKIIYVKVEDTPSNAPNEWFRETYQRNAIERALLLASPDDIIFISDVDEIPNIPIVLNGMTNSDVYSLEYGLYYYYLNLRSTRNWSKAKVIRRRAMCASPNEIRNMPGIPTIKSCGWHFSYLMNPEMISEKITSFSHQEYNTEEINNIDAIKNAMKNGVDLFGRRDQIFLPEPLDPCIKQSITKELEKYILPDTKGSLVNNFKSIFRREKAKIHRDGRRKYIKNLLGYFS